MRPNLLCKLHTALLSTISTFNALVAHCKIVSVELNTYAMWFSGIGIKFVVT